MSTLHPLPSGVLSKQAVRSVLLRWRHLASSAFAREVSGTFATRVALIVLGMVTSVMVTRILGPAGRGEFALAVALASLGAQFCNLGLNCANTYYVAHQRARLGALLGNSLLASGLVGIVFAAGYGVFAWSRPEALPISGILLLLALAWIPVGTGYQLVQGLLIGTHRVREYNTVEVLSNLLIIGLVALIILTGRVSVPALFAVTLVAVLASLTLSVRTLLKVWPGRITISRALFKQSVGYGFHIYVIALSAYVIRRADLFVIEHFVGKDASGIYSISQTLAEKTYLFPEILGMLLFPKLVEEVAARKRRTVQASLITLASIAVMFLLAVPLLKPAIRLLYGACFEASTTPGLILIAAMAFYGVGNIVGAYILAHGKNWALVLMWVGLAAANIGANVCVVPHFGQNGAACCLLGTYACGMLLQIGIASRIRQQEERS